MLKLDAALFTEQFSKGFSLIENFSWRGLGNPFHYLKSRGFACTIRPQQTKTLTFIDPKRDIIKRNGRLKIFTQGIYFEYRCHLYRVTDGTKKDKGNWKY